MKIYLAGTPGTGARERVVENYQKKIIIILGYSTGSILSSLFIWIDNEK